MLDVTITDGKMRYAGRMIRNLRRGHQEVFAGIGGINAHRELRATIAQSAHCRAGFLNGTLAALWGCTGSILSPTGRVWLTLTNEAASHPLLILRRARHELDELMATKTELVTTVHPDDAAALRLCAFLGFHAGVSGPSGGQSKWGRRTLIEFVRTNPELITLEGNSFVVTLGYHVEPMASH